MSTPIDITEDLSESGGSNPSVSQEADISTENAILHTYITGASTNVDVQIQSRGDSDMPWADLPESEFGESPEYNQMKRLNTNDLGVVRVVVTNQDGVAGNTCSVRAVLKTT